MCIKLTRKLSCLLSVSLAVFAVACQPAVDADLGVFIPKESPVIEAFEPAPAVPGKQIVIRGRNFSADSSVVKVLFGKKEVAAILSSNSLVLVRVPADAGDALLVDVAGKKSDAVAFALRPVTPVTQILSAPPALTNSADASFVFAMEVK